MVEAASGPDHWILWTVGGKPATNSTIAKALHKAQARAALPHAGPHRLQHTALTDLLASGTDLRTVMEIAGHEDIKTTEEYLHSVVGMARTGVDRCFEMRTRMAAEVDTELTRAPASRRRACKLAVI